MGGTKPFYIISDVIRTAPSNPMSVKAKLSAVEVFDSSPNLPQNKTVHSHLLIPVQLPGL